MPVTLKLATSLDGRIATAGGESRWITGPQARAEVHRLRAAHDAVVVGIETALADDPDLTVRLEDYAGPQPARVVLDSGQRLPLSSRLAATARRTATVVVATGPASPELLDAGVQVISLGGGGRPDAAAVVAALRGVGLDRLFVEGGGQVAASFLRAGVVDRLEWFRAPMVIGGEGRPAIGDMALEVLGAAPRFRRLDVRSVGSDLWESYERI